MTKCATDIIVPTRPTSLFEDLRALVKASGPNKHDQAINLCTACIEAGIDTKSAIMGTAMRLGLKRGHIARILKEGESHRWRLCEGRYNLIA